MDQQNQLRKNDMETIEFTCSVCQKKVKLTLDEAMVRIKESEPICDCKPKE